MKSTLILFSIIGLIFISEITPAYAVSDSCLKMALPNEGWEYNNPDSVKIDSCLNSPTFGKYFKQKGYELVLNYYIFIKKPITFDDVVTIDDIDSVSYPLVKQSFNRLRQIFGDIKFKRYKTETYDSDFINRPILDFDMTKYTLASDLVDSLKATTSVDLAFVGSWFSHNVWVEDGNYNRNDDIQIYPNPAADFIEISVGANGPSPLQNDVRIYNVFGQTVLSVGAIHELPLRVDISGLALGMYFVRIGDIISKFVKL